MKDQRAADWHSEHSSEWTNRNLFTHEHIYVHVSIHRHACVHSKGKQANTQPGFRFEDALMPLVSLSAALPWLCYF